jgi:prepilin-type N-terminal cleavage/methylation domain-containing protein
MKYRNLELEKKNNAGLTLLEVIIAITISAVVVGMLLSALRLGHRAQGKSLERDEVSQRVRILTDRLGWMLRGAYWFAVWGETAEDMTVYFDGKEDSVGFITTSVDTYSDSFADMSGLKWVRIFRDDEGLKMRETVFYSEDAFEEDFEGEEFLFDPAVKEISFEYLAPGDEEEGIDESWVSVWDGNEEKLLPAAVRVSMALEVNGLKFQVPSLVAAIRAVGPYMNVKKPGLKQ